MNEARVARSVLPIAERGHVGLTTFDAKGPDTLQFNRFHTTALSNVAQKLADQLPATAPPAPSA
jgi:hypothetical protein